MWFKKYTGALISVPERRTDEIDYWIEFEESPFEKGKTIVIRKGINPNLAGPDIYKVLGTLENHDPDVEWGGKYMKLKGRGSLTYEEFTQKYSERVEKKLQEIEILEPKND